MKDMVRITKGQPDGHHRPSEVIELDAEQATPLIEQGHAEALHDRQLLAYAPWPQDGCTLAEARLDEAALQ